MPFAFHNETEETSRPVRCAVELRDAARCQIGVARRAGLDGLRVQFLRDDGDSLSLGRVVQLNSDVAPIGPIRATARVAAVHADRDHRGKTVLSASLKFVDMTESQRGALRSRLQALRLPIVTIGLDESLLNPCRATFRVITATCAEDVMRHYDEEDVAVLVIGPRLEPAEAYAIVARSQAEFPGNLSVNIVLNEGATSGLFQEFVDHDSLFYLARGAISGAQLCSIATAAVTRFQTRLEDDGFLSLNTNTEDRVLDFCVRLSQQIDLANTGALLCEAMHALIGADRAQCLIHDRDTGTLRSTKTLHEDHERQESAAAGLVGYVTRTGEPIRLDRVDTDLRFDAEADDPGGGPDARFIAEPIFDVGGVLIAVATAARNRQSEPFSAEDGHRIHLLASCTAPTLSMVLMQTKIQGLLRERTQTTLRSAELFRQEAVDYHTGGAGQDGELLGDLPSWLKRSHLLILALILIGLTYVMFARVNEIATGPILIRARNKIGVTATTGGVVRSVIVSAGDHVREGDVLVLLQSAPGDTLLARLKQELRAPVDGVVSDINVRPGQQLGSGDQALSIVDEMSGNEMIALLPGSYAPQIKAGMNIVLKLQGYMDSHETVAIDSVAEEIVGPHEASRYIGRESTDALNFSGPIVIVRSLLHRRAFEANGRSYSFHDGMVGEAEVRVRSEPMIFSLLPGLKEIVKNPKKLLLRGE